MKKYILAGLTLLATTSISAQQEVGTWSIIPRIGVNLANLSNNDIMAAGTGDDVELKSKYKAGMKVGADVEYQFTRELAASLGVFYSMQGCRYADYAIYAGTGDVPTTKVYNGMSDFVMDYQYINVPLMLHCYVAQNFALKVGVQAGFLLKAKTSWSEQSYSVDAKGEYTYQEPESVETDDKSGMKKVDISIPLGLSYEYENVILDARYNWGLTKTGITGMRNKVFEFTVGYRFAL